MPDVWTPLKLRSANEGIIFEGEASGAGGGSMPGALVSVDAILTEVAGPGHSYPITAAAANPTNTFSIDGDHVDDFLPWDAFNVIGSSDNDGQYMVVSASFADGKTTIVTGYFSQYTITSDTADGSIYPSSYRAAVPIPAGSIVKRVLGYCLAAWSADTAVHGNVFDANGTYIEMFRFDSMASYDPLDVGYYSRNNSVGGGPGVISADLDSDGIVGPPTNIRGSYGPAMSEFNLLAIDSPQAWGRPGVPFDTDGFIYITAAPNAATPVVPTGRTRFKVEYFAPVTAIDAAFA